MKRKISKHYLFTFKFLLLICHHMSNPITCRFTFNFIIIISKSSNNCNTASNNNYRRRCCSYAYFSLNCLCFCFSTASLRKIFTLFNPEAALLAAFAVDFHAVLAVTPTPATFNQNPAPSNDVSLTNFCLLVSDSFHSSKIFSKLD